MDKIFLSHPHSAPKTAIFLAHWLEKVFSNRIEVICTSETEYHIDSGSMLTKGIVKHIESSSAVLILVTPESLKLPWIFYEMGVAHALEKIFIPCVAGGLSLLDLPVQAQEYQGVELSSSKDLRRLVDALSSYLDASPVALGDFDATARRFA